MAHDVEHAEHQQLLSDRETPSIGGSAAATIALETAGQQPPFGRSMFDLWLRLTGRAPDEQRDTDRLEMGRLMEEPVAIRFQRKTGLRVAKIGQISHPQHPWVTGHLDRILVGSEPGDVEIKTVGWYTGRDEAWSDPNKGEVQRIPISYLLQPVWYLGIPRLHEDEPGGGTRTVGAFERNLYLAAQFDLDKPLRVYAWEPDATLRTIHERMFESCQRFWEEYVLKDQPPPAPSSPDAAKRWLAVTYPTIGEEIQEGDAAFTEIALAYDEARKREKYFKEKKDQLGVELARLIGSNKGIAVVTDTETVRATISEVVKQAYTVKATSYRQVNVTVKPVKALPAGRKALTP